MLWFVYASFGLLQCRNNYEYFIEGAQNFQTIKGPAIGSSKKDFESGLPKQPQPNLGTFDTKSFTKLSF